MATKATGAPKCRTCGAEEFNHICSGTRRGHLPAGAVSVGPKEPDSRDAVIEALQAKIEMIEARLEAEKVETPVEVAPPTAVEKPKTDRKAYLREKARERRAAKRAGLTVQEYRTKMEKPE